MFAFRFSGYIPRMPFKFGDTYKIDCDVCIDDHTTMLNKTFGNAQVLRNALKSYPRLREVNRDPAVRDHLNTYRDTHPRQPILLGKSVVMVEHLIKNKK